MKPAPSSIVSPNSTKLNTGTIPRFLIIENKAEVEALLKSRFAAQIYIETLPVPDAIAGDNAYDVLIWNSDNSTSHKAKGLEMLERVSRRSPETQIIVISHEEGSPARFRIRSENYQYIVRPIDWNNLLVLVTQALSKSPPGQKILSYPDVRVPVEFEGMLGISLPMREVFQRIVEAASVDIPVLITGGNGYRKRSHRCGHSQAQRKKRSALCRGQYRRDDA